MKHPEFSITHLEPSIRVAAASIFRIAMRCSVIGGGAVNPAWDPAIRLAVRVLLWRHVYPSDIAMFPVDVEEVLHSVGKLSSLVNDLMDELQHNSERIVYGKAEVDQFYVAPPKPIIDKIDRALAKHYDFTDEELDFIINYDIKYRMGRKG